MFERFTTEAREIVLGAVRVADDLGAATIGTESVLIALAASPGTAGDALRAAGATEDRLREELAAHRGPADGEPPLDADALASIGIDVDEVRRAVEASFGPGALAGLGGCRERGRSRPRGHKPFTRESKSALERALREAVARRDRSIRTEHLLLGLLGTPAAAPASAATALLAACNVDRTTLRATLPPNRRAG